MIPVTVKINICAFLVTDMQDIPFRGLVGGHAIFD